ncbi:opacity protein [Christiangramia fulva]|uniref:Opacity protein n=1 Tax=Christiangramia fulva TaxID=2126553 RepID=A0A2R3Z7W0_9FLAO|nr:outer membrane beta-barrel protein [Christiangramia fulva]AVR46349.1 opacity protein [Christiangramia fulva]
MKINKKLGLGLLLFFSCLNLTAQQKWTFEFRPDLNFPTTKIENEKFNTGFGFDASISYKFTSAFGVYAGWGWNIYRIENLPDTGNIDIDETGYTFGVIFSHPISDPSFSYFLRLGGIYTHLELENGAGDTIASSDHQPGWEIAAGLDFSYFGSFSLLPQIGYRSFSADFSSEDIYPKIDLNNLFFGIGIAKSF